MKILIIDRSGFQLQTRQMLIEEAMSATVERASTLGELFIAFQKGNFDVVVIDHGIDNGEKYIEHILQIDPLQPVLVVSDAIHCVITRCEDCVKNHRIRRLFNPTPINNIVRMIEGFSRYACDHYDAETDKM